MVRRLFDRCSFQEDRGSVIILVALVLTALLGFCALVTDIGLMYAQKAHLQNAVDAAALAGVQDLPGNPDTAEQTAVDYAGQNGISEVSVSFEDNNASIIVQATEEVPTYFARIWGITQEQLSVSAKAMMVPPTELTGAVPLSIQNQNLVYGQEYTLKSGAGNGDSGWYGALDLSGNGADNYESDLANGYSGILEVGQIVDVEHGNMSGPTEKGVEARLSRDTSIPKNTFYSYDRNAPEIVYIPVVNSLSEDSSSIHTVQIVGFAAFFLEGVAGNGNNSVITGRFIQTIVPNDQTSASLSDLLNTENEVETGGSSSDYGLYTAKLVQTG
jgi:Flp pilus assembly protein TadG